MPWLIFFLEAKYQCAFKSNGLFVRKGKGDHVYKCWRSRYRSVSNQHVTHSTFFLTELETMKPHGSKLGCCAGWHMIEYVAEEASPYAGLPQVEKQHLRILTLKLVVETSNKQPKGFGGSFSWGEKCGLRGSDSLILRWMGYTCQASNG